MTTGHLDELNDIERKVGLLNAHRESLARVALRLARASRLGMHHSHDYLLGEIYRIARKHDTILNDLVVSQNQ